VRKFYKKYVLAAELARCRAILLAAKQQGWQ
jgi:hypothetical protein